MTRGSLNFEVTASGDLQATPANVEALRRLWIERTLINGYDLGPGDEGDFDYGAWHVACHLAGAGGVRQARDGSAMWLEISHRGDLDEYYGTLTSRRGGRIATLSLDGADARAVLTDSTLLGFVEGHSVGHVSARGVSDPPDRFNGWKRQDFDRPVDSTADGGKVWEHWCTLRDIRTTHGVGTSVLKAFVSLASALGDRFIPTVARGRREYGHPVQLAASVHGGLTARESALWDTKPVAIPDDAATLLLESDPARALEAVERLDWSNPPRYYMYPRRIGSWSTAERVAEDLRAFAPS